MFGICFVLEQIVKHAEDDILQSMHIAYYSHTMADHCGVFLHCVHFACICTCQR